MPLGMEVCLSPGHIVLGGGTQLPIPPERAQPSIFGPYLLWPHGWMDQDVTWYRGRPRPRPHCARWGPSSPQKRGTAPQICGPCLLCQTAGWIKMPLGTKVGLGPGCIVLHGDPASPKGAQPPNFGRCPLWTYMYSHPFQLLLSSCKKYQ